MVVAESKDTEKSVEFGQSTEIPTKSANSGGQKRRDSKRLSKKSSSFFNRLGASFRRYVIFLRNLQFQSRSG